MTVTRNITKERMYAGKIAFGIGLRWARIVEIARFARSSGYHYLFIDLEHSTMGIETATQISVAALDAGITPIVRVPNGEHGLAGRLLDGGAQGVVIPHVESAEEAKEAVARYRYPPQGHRSVMGSMVHASWQPTPPADLRRAMNDSLLIVVMLESPAAVERADEIAAVDGVDVLAIGANDLTTQMGIGGQYNHPDLFKAYAKVRAAVEKHGKILHLGGVYETAQLLQSIDLGSRMIMLDNDLRVLLKAMRGNMAALTEKIPPELLAEI